MKTSKLNTLLFSLVLVPFFLFSTSIMAQDIEVNDTEIELDDAEFETNDLEILDDIDLDEDTDDLELEEQEFELLLEDIEEEVLLEENLGFLSMKETIDVAFTIGTANTYKSARSGHFGTSRNFGLQLTSPYVVHIGPLDFNLGLQLNVAELKSNDILISGGDYTMVTYGSFASVSLYNFSFVGGAGFTTGYHDETLFTVTADVLYPFPMEKLPMDKLPLALRDLNVMANLHLQENLHGLDTWALSLLLEYPIQF
jgi:hypothetical protein